MDGLKNTSYIFVPLKFEKSSDFHGLVDSLDSSRNWTLVHDEIMYMFKYVADKLNSKDRKNCLCFHYELKKDQRKRLGLAEETDWYTTGKLKYNGEEECFRFQLLNIHLYCFSTSVCILAFKIHFEKNDPLWISAAQFYLKKVSRERIRPDVPDSAWTTMLDMAKRLLSEQGMADGFQFFFYANPGTERANVLTYLQVEAKEDYKYELFYLRHCYGDGFLYEENEKHDQEEIYAPSKDTVWGISSEAAVCLACPDFGRKKFICETFYMNFNAQYLYMYVLLLHQKYVLYMFLTEIGVGIHNNLEVLEKYQHQLYEFETDFVFSCVTEVPQYQNLYNRMIQAFSLKDMYEDVHEPLLSLSEVRRQSSEYEQKKRDEKVNHALLILSLLSFFSALADGMGFMEQFGGWFLNATGIRIAQAVCIVVIFISLIWVLKNLGIFKKKKKKK